MKVHEEAGYEALLAEVFGPSGGWASVNADEFSMDLVQLRTPYDVLWIVGSALYLARDVDYECGLGSANGAAMTIDDRHNVELFALPKSLCTPYSISSLPYLTELDLPRVLEAPAPSVLAYYSNYILHESSQARLAWLFSRAKFAVYTLMCFL